MKVTHQIAGISFRFDTDVPIPYLQGKRFSKYETYISEPDIWYRFRVINPDTFSLSTLDDTERGQIMRTIGFPPRWVDKLIFRSPDIREVLQRCLKHPEQVLISLSWNRVIIRDYAVSHLDLFYPVERRMNFSTPLFSAGYRNMVGTFLPNFSAFMIHGAGVIRNNLTAIFLAHDGGGKSSVARLANKSTILNDDHLILSQDGNGIMVHGTPFGVLNSGPQKARLGGFFILEKSTHFNLTPINPYDVINFLWDEHIARTIILPNNLRLRTFDILYLACTQVPVYRMSFPINGVDWDAIDKAMVV